MIDYCINSKEREQIEVLMDIDTILKIIIQKHSLDVENSDYYRPVQQSLN